MSERPYLHVLDGRMRVKVSDVKRSSTKAAEIQAILLAVDGIRHVTANPTTGNVLVLFDSQKLDHERILRTLRQLSRFRVPSPKAYGRQHKVVDTVLHSAVQVALERMLLALV
jgi:hypothetical protein